MKKTIFSLLLLFVAAFTFSSCDDVPMPYGYPDTSEQGGDEGGEGGDVLTGNGTFESPYDVNAAKSVGTGTAVYVKGYVVGYVVGMTLSSGATFSSDTCTVVTNILIAESADVKDYTKCMTVQLPTGDVRQGVNLKDNKGNLGQEITLCGNIEKYFGATGVKSVVWAKVGTKEVGTRPGEGGGSTVVGTPSGKGTEAEPYNVAAAQQVIQSGNIPTTDVYVAGTISAVKEVSTNHGNATYSISDDGTTAGQLSVYRGKYLGGAAFTDTLQIKVGDKVVVKGVLVNYMGNTPQFTTGSSIVSLNGATDGGGSTTPDPADPSTDIDMTGAISSGTVSGNTVTITPSELGVDNGVAVPAIKLPDGTVLGFASGGNSNAPKYYNTGTSIRMYPKNTMTIKGAKQIASIEITVDNYQGTIYNASGDVTSSKGTVACQDQTISISSIAAKDLVFTNASATTGAASQVRITKIVITYAG